MAFNLFDTQTIRKLRRRRILTYDNHLLRRFPWKLDCIRSTNWRIEGVVEHFRPVLCSDFTFCFLRYENSKCKQAIFVLSIFNANVYKILYMGSYMMDGVCVKVYYCTVLTLVCRTLDITHDIHTTTSCTDFRDKGRSR